MKNSTVSFKAVEHVKWSASTRRAILLLLGIAIAGLSVAYPQRSSFVRVYDLGGHKMAKGYLMDLTDSSFHVKRNGENREILASEVGTIRLRRSFGNTMAYTSAAGMIFLGIAGAASADNDASFFSYSASEGFLAGSILGGAGGAVLGSIFSGFRKRPVIPIEGRLSNWAKAKELLSDFLPGDR